MRGVLKQNISFAVRTLLKNKGFTITAVLTLALGIGASTAIFSVVYAVFEPMPYPNSDQLVRVWSRVRTGRCELGRARTVARGLAGICVPAWRASRVEPLEALRHE